MKKNYIFNLVSLPLTLSVTVTGLLSDVAPSLAERLPQKWEPKAYTPPRGLGTPERREPAGTRTGDGCLIPNKKLTAIVPSNSFGVTTSNHPSFFFYVPAIQNNKTARLDFVLIDDTRDTMNDTVIYATSILTNTKGGIVKVKLPDNSGLVNMEKNRDYLWKFSINCSSDTDPGLNFVQGRIRLVELKPEVKTKINQAKDEEKIALYAQAEIWFDALATAGDLRWSNPNNSSAEKNWRQLLKAVNLDHIAAEPPVKNK